ncbi:hypothetical protein OG563_28480 [Nocardia vinacea]|uniref:Uncharacterized protein n=1 Tax=Nocardia vinacea TaxID=96468 RepID=A0ABZ1YJE3_9NOCA|nr:hypothetical protein [Nocardia vinacea]
MTLDILAGIGALVLVLQAAAQVPAAVATLLRACQLVVDAARDLRNAITQSTDRLRDDDTDGL